MLQNIIKFLKKDFRWLLVLIISVAAFLRFWGAGPGYPPYHSDEGVGYSSAVGMIKEGNLDPGGPGYPVGYGYPSVVPLANFLLFKFFFIPVKWTGFYLSHAGQIIDGFLHLPLTQEEYKRIFQLEILGVREIYALIWGRYVTALFGVGVVFLTYLLGSKFFNRRAGLVVSFLVAVNYRQVLNSHIGLPDIYNAFFLLLAFLAALLLWEKPTRRRYFWAGVAAGLSFSTKYQFFSFMPLFLVHLDHTLAQSGWQKRVRFFLQPKAVIVIPVSALVFLLINPYHFVHWEQTLEQVGSVAGKYRTGRMMFDFYPIFYLYRIGVGQLTSLLVVFGVLIGILKGWKKSLLLLSVVVPFFFIMTYYTGGGFYTRNFVTITPFLLLFAGFFLAWLFKFFAQKKLGYFFLILLLLPAVWENFSKSIVVASEYSQEWNFKTLSSWLEKNIPPGSKIAAHSSVPLPVEGVERLPFDFAPAFTLDEFSEYGADYAIANLDWATTGFYWWMTQSTRDSLRYWNKPIDILEESYAAMALRELSDFAVYSVINSWQAPDSNFIVAKIPRYEVSKQELIETFKLNKGEEGWNSEPILVEDWQGFLIKARMRTDAEVGSREGFLVANFYKTHADAVERKNRIAVRLSSRNDILNQWAEKEFIGLIPKEATYMVIESRVYDAAQAFVYLDEVALYEAEVKADFSGVELRPFYLNPDVLFPASHGGL